MNKEFKKAVIFLFLILISFIIERALEPFKSVLIDVSPLSVFRLDENVFAGLGCTLVATLVAWISAVIGGVVTGHVFGASKFIRSQNRIVVILSTWIDNIYNFIYIIPLVITISLIYATLMFYHVNHGMSGILVVVGSVVSSGIALAGYQVFSAVASSIQNAGEQRIYLVTSLFYRNQANKSLDKHISGFSLSIRLSQFEIRQFVKALEIAFHLSIVSIVILESITPSFYENLFPQSGISPSWSGGVGGLIIKAQNEHAFREIAGILWVVFAVDYFFVRLIKAFSEEIWLKYYGVES